MTATTYSPTEFDAHVGCAAGTCTECDMLAAQYRADGLTVGVWTNNPDVIEATAYDWTVIDNAAGR